MQKKIFLICIFGLSILISSAQDKPDTALIKNKIIAFTRLSFSRSSPDSIIKFCGFPFYTKDTRSEKVYSSAAALKAELKKTFKREKNRPINYTIISIFKTGTCENIHLKTKKLTCIKMKIHMPDVGEGSGGQDMLVIFYIEDKFPYYIFGMNVE
jgi:hypothetical protein